MFVMMLLGGAAADCVIVDNWTYTGSDLPRGGHWGRYPGQVASATDCALRCGADDECKSFVFIKDPNYQPGMDNCIPKTVDFTGQGNEGSSNVHFDFGPPCAGDCVIVDNWTYTGSDLPRGGDWGRYPGQVASATDCALRCGADEACKSFVFIKDPNYQPGKDNCIPKIVEFTGEGNEGSSNGYFDFGPPCTASTPAPSCQRPSGWCTHGGAVFAMEDCDGDGILDPTCTDSSGHFGARLSGSNCGDTWPSGTCLEVGTPSPTPPPTVGPTPTPTPPPTESCNIIDRNVDYPGNDIQLTGAWGRVAGHLPSPEACREACRGTSGCRSWTFVKAAPAGTDNCAVKFTTRSSGNVVENAACCDSGQLCEDAAIVVGPVKNVNICCKGQNEDLQPAPVGVHADPQDCAAECCQAHGSGTKGITIVRSGFGHGLAPGQCYCKSQGTANYMNHVGGANDFLDSHDVTCPGALPIVGAVVHTNICCKGAYEDLQAEPVGFYGNAQDCAAICCQMHGGTKGITIARSGFGHGTSPGECYCKSQGTGNYMNFVGGVNDYLDSHDVTCQ